MFRKSLKARIRNVNALFNGNYVGIAPLYTVLFGKIPNVIFIPELDTTKVFAHMNEKHKWGIIDIYQHNYFNHEDKLLYFNNTIFIMRENRIVELTDNYAQILYEQKDFNWANGMSLELVEFRVTPEPVKESRIIGFARDNDASLN